MKLWRDIKLTWQMWKSLRAGGSIVVNCNFYGSTIHIPTDSKRFEVRPMEPPVPPTGSPWEYEKEEDIEDSGFCICDKVSHAGECPRCVEKNGW